MESNKNISLVLSGGGARGIAHIGVIETLEKHGYNIQSIVGTSMGALVGAIYCNGQLEPYKKWLLKLSKFDVFRLMDFTLSKQGLVKGEKIFNKMSEFIGDVNFEDLKIPLAISATDLTNNKEVVFTSGSLIKAVRASVSIPTVFTPVKHQGSVLIDGGVINNLPLSNAKRTENDLLVAVDVNANLPTDSKKDKLGYFDIIHKSIMMLIEKVSEQSIEKHQPDLVIKISNESANILDFYKAQKMIDIGEKAAENELKKLLLK